MKIDIITLHAVKNYGSVLQALATQEIFKEKGCQVRIINYIKEESKRDNLVKFWAGNNIIKKMVIWPTVIRWKTVFDDFCDKYLELTDSQYTSEEDFRRYPIDADLYCTGSDQVWNSVWNCGILSPLYLSFVPDDKYRFAFSASFGQQKLSEDEIAKTHEYIHKYNRISVRESSALSILQNQYKYDNAVHILDPTLCVNADFWRKYSSKRKVKEDYILIYNLNRSKAFDKYARELSRKTGLKLIRLCTRYDQFLRNGKSVLIPDVFDFISLIDNAKYVLTDSFHATAFSMNMGTEPICIYPPEFGGRLESFLKLTNSMQRHVRNYEDFDIVNRPVDFSIVNQILDSERKKAHHFIDEVLDDAKLFYEEKKG